LLWSGAIAEKGFVMSGLKSLVLYLCRNKSLSHTPISFDTLRYLVYLAHWKYALVYGQDLSETTWVFARSGPASGKFFDLLFTSPEIIVIDRLVENETMNISCNKDLSVDIKEPEKLVLDFVLSKEALLNEPELQKLVYSTYPMMTTPRFKKLDLINKAKDYIEMLQKSGSSEGEIKKLTSVSSF
jgi:hypothetical protein